VSLGGHIIRHSLTVFLMIGDCVNSSSTTSSFRLISSEVHLLNRYWLDFSLVFDRGDFGLDMRKVFLGGLGPRGEDRPLVTWTGSCLFIWVGIAGGLLSNSVPSEKLGSTNNLFCGACADGKPA
jgi:hypothetical protein